MNVRLLRCILSAFAASLIAGCSGSSSSNPPVNGGPSTVPGATLSAPSLTFASTVVGASSATQTVTLTNTGAAVLNISSVSISGTNYSSFSQTNTCGATLGAAAACNITVTFTPASAGFLTATLTFSDNATGSPQTVVLAGTSTSAGPTYSLGISPASLTFPSTAIGLPSASQTLTFTNTGTGSLTLSSVVVSGSNASFFTDTSTCGSTLAATATCTAAITFVPTASGAATAIFTVTDNAAGSPQTISLTGTGTGIASASSTVDCSVNTGFCPGTFSTGGQLASDPIAIGGFHGYADPSERKDPNSGTVYLAYSWARTLSDGTHVVDLHLASSANNGSSFTEAGPLYQSLQTTQTASTAYSAVNDSSTETVDLLPIPLTGTSAGQTLWVQAHQSYLVAPQSGIYDQLNATNLISVTAVQLANPAAANAGTLLLALSSAPEARLGAVSTDPSRNITQPLASLSTSTSKCGNWGQPALWYQTGTLYLALECTEITGTGQVDANELAHFLYSTTPTGADASKWTWAYAGEFLTGAQSAKLGALASEGPAYQFFTEPEFALTKSGQLVVIATPSVFAPQTAQQPVIQYGCRVIPIALTPTSVTLDIDTTTGAPVSIAKVTEADLYTGTNEGPAACTYEPAANNGIIIGRKYENDPTLGFYIYPVNTGIAP